MIDWLPSQEVKGLMAKGRITATPLLIDLR
jgi:hypothetical protein